MRGAYIRRGSPAMMPAHTTSARFGRRDRTCIGSVELGGPTDARAASCRYPAGIRLEEWRGSCGEWDVCARFWHWASWRRPWRRSKARRTSRPRQRRKPRPTRPLRRRLQPNRRLSRRCRGRRATASPPATTMRPSRIAIRRRRITARRRPIIMRPPPIIGSRARLMSASMRPSRRCICRPRRSASATS